MGWAMQKLLELAVSKAVVPEAGRKYISVVEDDERIVRMSCGHNSDTHDEDVPKSWVMGQSCAMATESGCARRHR